MNSLLEIYKQVLIGQISVHTFRQQNKSILAPDEKIYVTPENVAAMLTQFLNGTVSAEEIAAWSDFLLTEDVYTSPGYPNENETDKYEPMWWILQQLSSPEIDGYLDVSRAEEHLEVLDELKNALESN